MNERISVNDYSHIITVEPGKRGGQASIRDLTLTVGDVLERLAEGKSERELLDHSPGLTKEDIRACLAFAAARERHREANPPERKAVNDYSHIITIEPGKRSGQPCIRGMRMTVYDILEYVAGGMTFEEILDDFPYLTMEDILASIAFVADRKRRFALVPLHGVVWSDEASKVVDEPWVHVSE